MRIIFLSFYSGISDRGAEVFVHELAQRLAEKNEVKVFQTGPITKNTKYEIIRISVNSKPEVSGTKNIFRRLFLTARQNQELKFYFACLPNLIKLKPDVVFPVNSGWQIPIYKLCSKLFRFKLAISGQSGPGWDDRWNLFWRPDLFIALTARQLKWAQKVCPRQKFALVPNGVDIKQFKPAGTKFKHHLIGPVVLTVAASIPSKQIPLTINAMTQTNASLLLVGTGYLDREIDSLGKSKLGKRFLHLQVPHQQMPELYRSADIFTLCSDQTEAFGIVYLEAMASGLPVVAPDDESRREIAGNAGIFVENPENSNEYARALIKALKTTQRINALNRAEKFSWGRVTEKYEEVLSVLQK